MRLVDTGASKYRKCKILKKAIKASLRNIIYYVDNNDVTMFMFEEGILTTDQFEAVEKIDTSEPKVCFIMRLII